MTAMRPPRGPNVCEMFAVVASSEMQSSAPSMPPDAFRTSATHVGER
jgi:hypothetical protein